MQNEEVDDLLFNNKMNDSDSDDSPKRDKSHSMTGHSASKHFPYTKQPSQIMLDNSDEDVLDDSSPKYIASMSGNRESSRLKTRIGSPSLERRQEVSLSDSDESDELGNTKTKLGIGPGEYDPKTYENLNVSEDIKELFQYITKYVPQQLNLDYKFKPFIPDFIPAVGDIDAFLKVIPPKTTLSGENFKSYDWQLGLIVLDEPIANQSDPALLHLQLRAASITVNHNNETMVVKKINDVEKNSKTIDKWIKDVSELHRNKSTTTIKYSEPMPDIDELLQEWPEEFENSIKVHNIPNPKFGGTLSQYINIICAVFDIPIYKNKIESLHVLFSLYVNIKNSQIYHDNSEINLVEKNVKNEPDHLVLD
ncbi:hypothetical protein FQR65_LT05627 [Abscondita terminalis]|nr:hypothetical protein FQR65_LT05627 [Abscondita terminalis]